LFRGTPDLSALTAASSMRHIGYHCPGFLCNHFILPRRTAPFSFALPSSLSLTFFPRSLRHPNPTFFRLSHYPASSSTSQSQRRRGCAAQDYCVPAGGLKGQSLIQDASSLYDPAEGCDRPIRKLHKCRSDCSCPSVEEPQLGCTGSC
jgi:hypothetical protein